MDNIIHESRRVAPSLNTNIAWCGQSDIDWQCMKDAAPFRNGGRQIENDFDAIVLTAPSYNPH